MSDDRFIREPGDDTEEAPDRTYIDPKPRSWYGPPSTKRKPFNLADECEKFLADYCAKFGIKSKQADKKRLVRPEGWDDSNEPIQQEPERGDAYEPPDNDRERYP